MFLNFLAISLKNNCQGVHLIIVGRFDWNLKNTHFNRIILNDCFQIEKAINLQNPLWEQCFCVSLLLFSGSSFKLFYSFSYHWISWYFSFIMKVDVCYCAIWHCVKSVQIQSYFCCVFSCIQSEYSKIWTRNNSVF